MARTARKTRVSSAATSLFGLIACSFRHLTLRDRLCHANPCGTRLAVPLCLSRMHLLTSSSIRAFRLCGMKYKLSYLDLIEPVKSTSALIFGTNVHLMLEAYWRARKARAKDPLAAAMAAMPKMEKFEEVRAKVMMLCYALIWNPILCEVIDVEIAFDLPLVHPVTGEVHPFFRRAGKIDLMLRLYNKDGSSRIALVEHKTTSDTAEEGGDYMRRLTLDEQLSVYFDAAESMDLRPDVIVYDVLRKPSAAPKKASENPKVKKDGTPYKNARLDDETPEAYGERLIELMSADPKKYIKQQPVYRFAEEMEAFRLEVWKQAEQMRVTIENDLFTHNSHACMQNYGACGYLPACEGSARLGDRTMYRKKVAAHTELHLPVVQ